MKNSEQAIKLLNSKLGEYLSLKGLKVNGKNFINCINPNHDDRHPSMNFYKSEQVDDLELLHCFSCQTTCTIFTAAHYIEGLPISGREFFNITLPTLCNYFGIEYKPEELTEDEREAYNRKRAYRDAANIICNLPKDDTHQTVKRILDRGYTRTFAKSNYIGGIDSFNEYLKSMKNIGWDQIYLDKIDLLNKGIFNSNNIIFAIRNEYGEPVGFVARRVPWTKSSGVSKFENSPNSDIYRKGHILYNLDKAKKIKKGPLWIVEGYPDTNTLMQQGLLKVAGIGGIAFTDDHAELLNRENIYDLIICLDGDKEGMKATENTLEKLSKYKCFNVKVVEVPFNLDPDDYVKENGLKKFKLLSKITPFEWMLKHSDSTGTDLVNKTIPIILEEKNFVNQRDMCFALSKLSGIEVYVIRKEVDRRQDKAEDEFLNKVDDVKDRCINRLQKERTNVKSIINETLRDIERLETAHQSSLDEDDIYLNRFNDLKQKYITNPELLGHKINSFPRLQKALDGIPKTQSLIALAGKPNVGKTSFLRYLTYDLVTNNEDLVVLFMTIDDNYEKTITPFVAIDQNLTINQVKKPNLLPTEDLYEKFEQGWKKISNIQKENLVIRDITSGNDLISLERQIEKCKNKFPHKHLIVLLDNFHKLGGLNRGTRRESIVERSERIKEISNLYNIPILMTVELRKMNHVGRPMLEDISESNQVEYDCDIIMLLHNELHNDKYTDLKWEFEGMDMPYLELDIAKNKETSSKVMIPYEFTTTKSIFKETDGTNFESKKKKTSQVSDIITATRDYDRKRYRNAG